MCAARSLLFSTLYPSAARPTHGIFVETRLRELLKLGKVQARVVAPVPWFPARAERWGNYARIARTPMRERRHEIDVLHPRYPLLPKVGMTLAPLLLALGARAAVQRVLDEGFDFDVIDAHYLYPDGVAAALLARWFRRPLVMTARGSDVNLIARYTLPRSMMRWAAGQAVACIGVSGALIEAMRSAGIAAPQMHLMRNGVDLQRFRPLDRSNSRAVLGVAGEPLLLSVGNLIPLKGHDLAIEAVALLRDSHPEAHLAIIGEGPERERLQRHAQAFGVAERVRLIGLVPNAELAAWYSAADLLLLASSREGWPNVLLEAMACGTPVIASRVGGVPEVCAAEVAGQVLAQRSAQAIAEAVHRAIERGTDRIAVRRYAESFGWEEISRQQADLFGTLAASRLDGA